MIASDYFNQHKGVLIEVTGEGTVKRQRYLHLLCCVNINICSWGTHGEILLAACHNDSNVTITPTQSVVLPVDAQDPDNNNITVAAGSSHTLVLHSPQTLLIAITSNNLDLSGTKIVSTKPLIRAQVW